MRKSEMVKIFMDRDGMSKDEALAYYKSVRRDISEIISDGGNYEDLEDYFYNELGLEMDYLI